VVWVWDPAVMLSVVLAAALYARGWLHLRRRKRAEAACFYSGLGVIVIALCSPIGAYDAQLFSLHMSEHLLLALVAPPLLLLGRPLVAMLWGLPPQERLGAARLLAPHGVLARIGWKLTQPRTAVTLYVVAFAVWHLPALYDLAQGASPIHWTEHITFFATALLFWWPVIHPHGGPRRLPKMAAIVYFAVPMVEGALLGGLLTLANTPLYRTYALEDQQLAGLIMWIPGGIVYAAAVLAALLSVLREENARANDVGQLDPPAPPRDDTILFEHA
jgi:putative membrane protein